MTFELKHEKPESKIEINIEKSDKENENDVFIENSQETENCPFNKSSSLTVENNYNSDLNLVEPNKRQSESSSNLQSSVLCIKVNKNKDFINCPLNRKMKNRIESEFWFQINDTR